jgi:hypothetical protein
MNVPESKKGKLKEFHRNLKLYTRNNKIIKNKFY